MQNSKSNLSNTGYKGICFRKDRGKFIAQVAITVGPKENHKTYHLGNFDLLQEAIKTREEFIRTLY